MKKAIIDLRVSHSERVGAGCVLLKLRPVEGHLPECRPGQFAQLRVDAPGVFLRRPISIHDVEDDEISFLVQMVGEGTRWIFQLHTDDVVNAVMPLGNGFSLPRQGRVLLVGGGVGVAPLFYQGRMLKQRGVPFAFLMGARTRDLLLRLDAFCALGDVFVTTEDGSEGECGFVTQHSILGGYDGNESQGAISLIQTCGPTPMMRAVARYAQERGIACELSLENRMACGIGACLCCVQQTTEGHKCVCTDGPVFASEYIIENI